MIDFPPLAYHPLPLKECFYVDEAHATESVRISLRDDRQLRNGIHTCFKRIGDH